jgi:ABC-type branched-subunit amino acid transport system ATPase component/ABC-type branched-subunit amino acid transport system permease subunit
MRKPNLSEMQTAVLIIILWVAGACLPQFFGEPFLLHVFNLIFVGIVLALSWAILARTGYVSFAHNAFLGIGAYTSVYLMMQMHLPFWAGFLSAGVMAGIFAFVLGVIILRLKGIFFVLSTFCFAQIMLRVFRIAEPITGGANGIRDIPPPMIPLIGPLKSHEAFYILFYLYATLVVLFTVRLYRSNTGREFQAIGEDMFTAESIGIYTTRQKVVAFVISSVIVGFTGSLHAHYTGFISDTTFEMVRAIEGVIYNVVGGMGSIVGPIIGTAIMVPLPEYLRGFVAYQIALYGLILILILRFFPSGVWGTVKRIGLFCLPAEKKEALKLLRLTPKLAQGFLTDFWGTDCNPGNTLLECREISRYFGGLAALSGVSFSVKEGEIFGIVGPNGAGKSTLFNMITGIFVPSKGRVVFGDKSIGGLIPSKINRLGVSRVFQATVLFSEATVRENVTRALVARAGFNGIKDLFKLENEKHQQTDTQARVILKLCGLESASEELAKNLPYGFQRLLGLAMALAGRPKLLLLDEPVAGMSAEERETIADILVKLREKGMTMIVVEHNVDFIMRLCSRIMVLNYGEKIAEGNPEEVRNNPKVIEAFLGA